MESPAGWHVLIVGNGRDIPGRVRKARPDMKVTMMVRAEVVGRILNPGENWAIVGLPHDGVERWVETARYLHQTDPFDAIANFTEKDQEKFPVIARALGLPGPGEDTIRWMTDKHAMRQRLARSGLDDTRSTIVNSHEEVVALLEEWGDRVVLKPIDGSGSAGVTVLDSIGQIGDAISRARDGASGSSLIVEEYLDGSEWSVEAISEGGTHLIGGLTKKFKSPLHCVEYAHVVRAELSPEDRVPIERLVKDVLTALGVVDGITHTELILTKRGPRVVETHLRPAGDEIPEMLRDHYGIDLIDAIVRQSAGESVADRVREQISAAETVKDHIAVYYTFPPEGRGKIKAIEGAQEARRLPGVQHVDVLVGVGDDIGGDVLDSDSRVIEVKAVGSSEDEALLRARLAAEAVRILVEEV